MRLREVTLTLPTTATVAVVAVDDMIVNES